MIPIIDVEFQSLIPPLTQEEYAGLEASILKEGCRDALVLWKETLVDGHNRLAVCQKHGLPYETRTLKFEGRDEAKIWILNNQLARRNLTPYQRAEIALALEGIFKAKGKERQREGGAEKVCLNSDKAPIDTKKELAKIAGVGHDTMARVKKIAEQAPEDVKAKLRTGEVSINQAYKDVIGKERQEETAKARIEMAQAGLAIQPSDRWNVYLGDINTWEAPRQYDFIITDPPYPKEYLPLYESLAIRATEWLKDGGLLIAMCGQSYLDIIYQSMSKYIDYYWTACYLTPGQPTPLRQINVNTTWKPVLVFRKNEYKGKIFGDVFKSNANDKGFHKWGQSESGMFDIISGLCLPGQYILDCFCGAGTTGVAALRHGCLFDGLDIDQESVNISKSRLNDATKE